jgi:toxin FitB
MFILDTNVLSEEMRASLHTAVHAWLKSKPASELFTTAITEAELLYGVAVLTNGQRKDDLRVAAMRILNLFSGRILPFDRSAAAHHADILAARKLLGRPIGSHDAQIAAIARSRGMTVATRDIRDFTDCSVPLVDPWNM